MCPEGIPFELRPKTPHCSDSGAADRVSAAAAESTTFSLRIILRLLRLGTPLPRRNAETVPADPGGGVSRNPMCHSVIRLPVSWRTEPFLSTDGTIWCPTIGTGRFEMLRAANYDLSRLRQIATPCDRAVCVSDYSSTSLGSAA